MAKWYSTGWVEQCSSSATLRALTHSAPRALAIRKAASAMLSRVIFPLGGIDFPFL